MKHNFLPVITAIAAILFSCSESKKPLTVRFEGAYSEKNWKISVINKELPSDWSSYRYLTFEFNSGTTQKFVLSLHDAGGKRQLEILPFMGVWVRASIPIIHFQKMNTEGIDQASIWKTPLAGCWIGFTRNVGPVTSIDSLGVSMEKPVGSPSLQLRNFRLTNNAEDTIFTDVPLVDEFGQWINCDWPGKAISLEELKKAWTEEEMSLNRKNPDISQFGGFKKAKSKQTGFFHVEKIDGKWWFIDPEGYLFYSNGSCCIEPGTDLARLKGREYIFRKLPPDAIDYENGKHKTKSPVVSYYTWNLTRRFGDNWHEKWIELSNRRMEAWGINTVGNWSDPALGNNHKKAYVATLEGWGIENGKMGMPDVYSQNYEAIVDSAAAKQCLPHLKDPWLLGYFIGNEPAWPGRETELAETILNGEESPIKEALRKFLADGDTPEKRKKFASATFDRFLTVVCKAIKKYDPDHLNLGLRFSDPPSDEITKLCKTHFNVFSINHYGYSVNHDVVQHLYELTGLPVIIGEFHFGIPRRGLAPGLVQTRDPDERAVAYRYYVENAAAHPAVIGTHWFQWIDQPSTGRFDGENYNIGILDVTDRPYPEMLKAIQETFGRLLEVHSGKEPPVSREALPK